MAVVVRELSRLTAWYTHASFEFDALAGPVAVCVIDAVDVAICDRPTELVMFSYTTALLFAVELVWLIVHAWVSPDVLMQAAVLVPVTGRFATCTTAQLAVEHRYAFLPPAGATCTTGCVVVVQLQRRPGHCAPA
jgi:hypothetical protein